MLRVFFADRFDLLAQIVAASLPRHDPFATTTLLTSHPLVARWLTLSLAHEHGAIAGVHSMTLERYAFEQARLAGDTVRAISAVELTSLLASAMVELPEVAARLLPAGSEASPRARVAAAEQLARLWFELARTRPSWFVGGRRGAWSTAGAEFAWQEQLYGHVSARLAAYQGVAEAVLAPLALWRLSELGLGADARSSVRQPDPTPLHVVGFSYFVPSDLLTLRALARHREVRVYQWSASGSSWQHPWARPMSHTVDALRELADEVDGLFAAGQVAVPSQLTRWRSAIATPSDAIASAPPDRSLELHACPSPRRELEVAFAALARRLVEDPTLQARELAVLIASGAAKAYLPLVPLVTAQPTAFARLPYRLADAGTSRSTSVGDAVLALLRLSIGAIHRDDVLAVLSHPGFALADAANSARWILLAEQLEIFIGADASELQGTYLADTALGHWEQGLRRLTLGVFASEQAIEVEGAAYRPHAVAASDPEGAAEFVMLVRSVLADVRTLRAARWSLRAWCDAVMQLAVTYAGTQAAVADAAFAQALRHLRHADFDERLLEVGEFAARLASLVNERSAAQPDALCDGIYVGVLVPGRPLPFRHVCIVGLGEQTFPMMQPASRLDPRQRPEAGDVSSAERDQQALFDAMTGAHESVTLCYTSQAADGSPLQPSPVILELAEALAPQLGASSGKEAGSWLTTHHPLYPWDELSSASARLADVGHEAHIWSQTVALARQWGARRGLAPEDAGSSGAFAALPADSAWRQLLVVPSVRARATQVPRRELSVSALREFLTRPAVGWFRAALGVMAESHEEPEPHEPFESGPLHRSAWLRQAVEAALRGDPWPAASEVAPVGGLPLGMLYDGFVAKHAPMVTGWVEQLRAAGINRLHRERFGTHVAADGIVPRRLVLPVQTPDGVIEVEFVGDGEWLNDDGEPVLVKPGKLDHSHAYRLGLAAVLHAASMDGAPWGEQASAGDESGAEPAAAVMDECGDELTNESGDAHPTAQEQLAEALGQAPRPRGWVGHVVALKHQLTALRTVELQRWEPSAARAYLSALLSELLTGAHAYRLNSKNILAEPQEERFESEVIDDSYFPVPPNLEAIYATRYRPLVAHDDPYEGTTTNRAPRTPRATKGPSAPRAPRKQKKKS